MVPAWLITRVFKKLFLNGNLLFIEQVSSQIICNLKYDSAFHRTARRGFQSALFYLLKAWAPQIKSVCYNIELWVLPNLINSSRSYSHPRGTSLSIRYIVSYRIQAQAKENHCKGVLKRTKLILPYNLLYPPFVELPFMLCYLSL